MRIRAKKKGMVLVGVLWLVIILTVIVATSGRSSRIDMKMMTSRVDNLRCRWAGRAGIERGIAILTEDEADVDGLLDLWATNPDDLNDVPLEGCRFTVRIVDESGKLNVNTATREQLLMLPYMTEDIADAIIDWRDSDSTPGSFGAESDYYSTMPYPYLPRDGSFRTIRELLLVKDVTEELLYGEDTNFNGQLDLNERDGTMSPPNDDGDNELDLGWIAYLTCYTGEAASDSSQQGSIGTSGSMGGTGNISSSGSISRGGGSSNTTNTNSGGGNTGGNTGSSNNGPNNAGGNDAGAGTNNDQGTTTGQSSTEGSEGGPVNVNTASEVVLAALLGSEGLSYDDAYFAASSIVNYRDEMGEGLSDPSELVDGGAIEQSVYDQISGKLTTTSNVFVLYCNSTAMRRNMDGARLLTEVVVDRSSTPAEVLYWHQGTGY